ncbi:Rha family transcriptional regulator [Vibrio fluvialis]|nr:Rha family transcriptional regulator [Vibrio fluvialis]
MTNINVLPAFDLNDMVIVNEGEVITTSLKVAEYFDKQHKNVIRAIRRLESECSENFTALNFELCYKNNELQNGKPLPFYNMTKDGFMLLVMGFTGKTATQIKISYIQAFNWMAEKLRSRQAMGEDAMNQFVVKDTRSKLKGTIGSRLMNERKKEKPRLLEEEQRVRALYCPQLFHDRT